MINLLERAEMFATYASAPILFLSNPFGDGHNYWFLVYSFKEANPSNHIFVNEIIDGRDITFFMHNTNQYDQQLFLSNLLAVGKSRLVFPQSVSWIKLR